ncbi:MAG: FeoB-associated Cys-rich membrane protein [Oscillospiraceae bacterium]|jgi:uncharacterized membrane protein YccC|nr:FeoB-associated Cys-rich membrane protein [Oscillospiraceae bacterium]
MVNFLMQNLGAIITGLLIAVVIAAVVLYLIRSRRKGGACANCSRDCSRNPRHAKKNHG